MLRPAWTQIQMFVNSGFGRTRPGFSIVINGWNAPIAAHDHMASKVSTGADCGRWQLVHQHSVWTLGPTSPSVSGSTCLLPRKDRLGASVICELFKNWSADSSQRSKVPRAMSLRTAPTKSSSAGANCFATHSADSAVDKLRLNTYVAPSTANGAASATTSGCQDAAQ